MGALLLRCRGPRARWRHDWPGERWTDPLLIGWILTLTAGAGSLTGAVTAVLAGRFR